MEAILEKAKNKKQSIGYSVLKRNQSELSESKIKIAYLRTMAERLDNAVIDNDITMQEIIDEVNAVRKERYEKQNRI